MPPGSGIFAPVFETAHGYLALLGLRAADASESIARVRDCCRRTEDPFRDICQLLADANWRPHLVAAVAMIVSGYHAEAVRLLWRRLDTGSWVTPQIGVALSIVDPEFLQRARERLEAGCPLDSSDLRQMTAIERHSAAGPAGAVARSAKAAKVLLYLVRMRLPQSEWLDDVVAATDFQSLIREDIDGSDGIAEVWFQRVAAIMSEDDHDAQKG
jgi:hypothetical protein